MTTQTTKPEPAIGQRWSDGKNVWVLTERGLDGFRCRHDTDATRISFAMDMWLANGATYLGPTEPGGGDTASIVMENCTATSPKTAPVVPQTDSGPAEGNVEETTRPRAPAKASADPLGGSKKRAESSPRHPEATSGEHARAGYGTPAPIPTALQPLATFFIPGDVAEQTTAYFTRTRAR